MGHAHQNYIDLIFANDGNRGWEQYFDDDRGPQDILEYELEKNPALELEVLHTCFTKKTKLLSGYSIYQLANGIDCIFNPSLSNLGFCFRNKNLSLKKQKETILGLFSLFSNTFNESVEPILGHLGEIVSDARNEHLNHICYMFWDTASIPFKCSDGVALACLEVMKKCACSNNVAVVEGAIHGLGHMIGYGHDEDVRRYIDGANFGYCSRTTALRRYAEAAKQGRIQ